MITTNRDMLLGIHVTEELKERIRKEAERRNQSMSLFCYNLIQAGMKERETETVTRARSNTRLPSSRITTFVENGVTVTEEEIPLPFVEKSK